MSDRFNKGIEIYRQVLGDEVYQKASKALGPEFTTLSVEFMYGDIYSRPHLDLKTREIIVMAGLIALNQIEPLKFHFAGALKNGFTKKDLIEIIIQCIPVVGLPIATSAMLVAKEFFDRDNNP